MTENAKNDAEPRSLDCLRLVRELSAEMNAALAALAGNDLQRFESSVAAQERLCETVRGLLSVGNLQPTVQLAAAGRELRLQNRVYVAALTRAAQFGAALLSLYQGSSRGYSRDGRLASTRHTWSCEV